MSVWYQLSAMYKINHTSVTDTSRAFSSWIKNLAIVNMLIWMCHKKQQSTLFTLASQSS